MMTMTMRVTMTMTMIMMMTMTMTMAMTMTGIATTATTTKPMKTTTNFGFAYDCLFLFCVQQRICSLQQLQTPRGKVLLQSPQCLHKLGTRSNSDKRALPTPQSS